MNDRDRLKQLQALRDHLNRLPASAERDRMLREVGSRAVDLESSEPKATMLPLTARPKDLAEPAAAAPATPSEAPVHQPERARRAPARRPGVRGEAARIRTRAAAADAFIASVRPTPALADGSLLSLEDDIAASSASDLRRPWTRGLRG
jgi:hypothetical protein